MVICRKKKIMVKTDQEKRRGDGFGSGGKETGRGWLNTEGRGGREWCPELARNFH